MKTRFEVLFSESEQGIARIDVDIPGCLNPPVEISYDDWPLVFTERTLNIDDASSPILCFWLICPTEDPVQAKEGINYLISKGWQYDPDYR